jgi:hypothetical protein
MRRKLASNQKTVKITIPFAVSTVEFMKQLAKKRKTTHQELMSEVLERHARTA